MRVGVKTVTSTKGYKLPVITNEPQDAMDSTGSTANEIVVRLPSVRWLLDLLFSHCKVHTCQTTVLCTGN